MARQLRIEFDGAFYHITSRGNLRGKIFFKARDREKFLEILKRTKDRYGYRLHAYALMDNHYHLLVETPKANISRVMQNINTSYTVYINRKYQRSGHLFQGRFKGIIVDKDAYLVTLNRYIHLNPVRAKIVQRPEQFQWTSYRTYINGTSDKTGHDIVTTADTLRCFSERRDDAVKAYNLFVESGIEGVKDPFEDLESGLVLGSDGFKEKITNLLGKDTADDELPQIRRLRKEVPDEKVIKSCCRHYGISEEDLLRRGKGKIERQIAIYLMKLLSDKKTNKEIGSFFGVKGPAVSGVIKKLEGRMMKDKGLKEDVNLLSERMINDF
ncbi:MAG: transposase [Nitrospirae bacterium]|nr:transposase [Nitrospirota bacterium]